MTPAERARAMARQRAAHRTLQAALAERHEVLPLEARLLDVEGSAALLEELQARFPEARSSADYRTMTGLDRSQMAEQARVYFSRQRQEEAVCMFSIRADLGGIALPAGFLSSQLALLLDVDGDAVFGKWGSEVFVFDYTADLGVTGYEVLLPVLS